MGNKTFTGIIGSDVITIIIIIKRD